MFRLSLMTVLASVCIAAPMEAYPAMASVKPDFSPDFSSVTSREQALALVRQGRLVRILLFPAELGGEDRVENVSFVSPEAADALALVIGTLKRFTAEGLVNRMTVDPEYRGDSLVPARIVFHATHDRKEGGFHPVVEVW